MPGPACVLCKQTIWTLTTCCPRWALFFIYLYSANLQSQSSHSEKVSLANYLPTYNIYHFTFPTSSGIIASIHVLWPNEETDTLSFYSFHSFFRTRKGSLKCISPSAIKTPIIRPINRSKHKLILIQFCIVAQRRVHTAHHARPR